MLSEMQLVIILQLPHIDYSNLHNTYEPIISLRILFEGMIECFQRKEETAQWRDGIEVNDIGPLDTINTILGWILSAFFV